MTSMRFRLIGQGLVHTEPIDFLLRKGWGGVGVGVLLIGYSSGGKLGLILSATVRKQWGEVQEEGGWESKWFMPGEKAACPAL